MQILNRTNFPGVQYPTKIIQFGEGNFLRAFIDWQIDLLNEKTDFNAGVTVVRPINTDFPPSLNTQDGLYTTIIRGLDEQGNTVKQSRIIRCVNNEIDIYRDYDAYLALARNPRINIIFSNTTEAGISDNENDRFDDRPPQSYPAKLTRLLFERFKAADGDNAQGFIILPCELIDYNGEQLKKLVLKYADKWRLGTEFTAWLKNANTFCSTLVDRIVTGYPRDEAVSLETELGYRDGFLDTAEYFYLFVIQGPQWLRQVFRLDQVKLNVLVVDDIKPYKDRKVAILNGAHTALVPVAYLSGVDTVGEAMNDAELCRFIKSAVEKEIIPVLSLPQEELQQFAEAAIKRFRNPFIRHQLLSIALNGMTKYRTRILPQLQAYVEKYRKLPPHLTFAFAALIAFYRGNRNGRAITLQDDEFWLKNYQNWWRQVESGEISTRQLVHNVLKQTRHWGQDLNTVPGLAAMIGEQLQTILDKGMRAALAIYNKD